MLTPSVNVVQSSFPEALQGEISGLSRSVSNLGSSFGTAIAGTILVSVVALGNQVLRGRDDRPRRVRTDRSRRGLRLPRPRSRRRSTGPRAQGRRPPSVGRKGEWLSPTLVGPAGGRSRCGLSNSESEDVTARLPTARPPLLLVETASTSRWVRGRKWWLGDDHDRGCDP